MHAYQSNTDNITEVQATVHCKLALDTLYLEISLPQMLEHLLQMLDVVTPSHTFKMAT